MGWYEKIKNGILGRFVGKDIRELLYHSKNYLSAELVVAALAFLTLPIVSRILTPDEYGIMSIFITLVSVSNIVFLMAINGAITVNFMRKQFPHGAYLFSNLVFLTAANVIFFVLALLLKDFLSATFNIQGYIILMTALTAAGNTFFLIKIALLEIKKQSKPYSLLYALKNGSIFVIAVLLMMILPQDKHNGWVIAAVILSIGFAIYCYQSLLKESSMHFKIAYVKDALAFGLLLLPHALSGFILRFFDQIIINQLVGAAKTGLYAFAYNIGHLMNLVVMAMSKSWFPMFLGFMKKKEWNRINVFTHKYAKFVYLAAIAIMLFSKELIVIVADKAYFESIQIMPIIILSYVFVFLYTLYTGIPQYEKRADLISISTIFAAAVNIILNYLLIPQYGYMIAAWTTLISYFLLFLFHYLSARFVLKFDKLYLKSVLPDFVVVLVVFGVLLYLNTLGWWFVWEFILKTVIFGLSALYLFRKNIVEHTKRFVHERLH